jgi:RND family efflux transporter MFP subunit
MNRRIFVTVAGTSVVSILVVILVCGIASSGGQAQVPVAQTGGSDKVAAGRPAPVAVTQPVRRALHRNLSLPATLRADERADLYAKTSGYVTQVNADIGSYVRKGAVLLTIAVPEMAAELRQCEAILEAKRAKVQALAAAHELQKITTQRKEQLAEEKAISRQELDEALSHLSQAEANTKVAESDVAVAKANVARLKALMGYATVTPPFDGVITTRNFDVGAFVRSAADGQTVPLFRIAKTDKIRVALEIPEPDVPFVHVGTEVEIHIGCLEGQVLKATVARTARVLKSDTRTMLAEVDIDNKAGRVAAGMYAQVQVMLESKENSLLIPSKSIRVRGRDTSVLVSRDSTARSVPVEIGYDDGIWTEVVGGQLKDDDWIITSAGSSVAPGASVKAVLETNSAGS